MAGAKRRSPTSTLVTKHSIESAGSALVELPEKPKEIWSLREAIDALKDQITLALDRGYTYPEISQMLTQRGVEISASTLKYYLSSVKRQDPNARPRRRRRTLGTSISAESLNLAVAAAADATPAAIAAPPAATPKKRGRAAAKTTTKAPAKTTAAKTKTKRGQAAAKATSETATTKEITKAPRTTKTAAQKTTAKKTTTSTKAKTGISSRRKTTASS
jgi:hypothetical protein